MAPARTRLFRLRRIVFRVRRSVPRVARPISALTAAGAPKRPIFLIGCPRSGTTVLLDAFLRSPDLRTVQREGHILWDDFHPRDRRVDHSDALDASDVSEREREYVYTAIRLFVRDRRFVDKTPENSLRIPYLAELFPDAAFVFLRRRAADTVNSLIEGWRARPRFVTHRLPEPLTAIAPLDGRLWSFALIPGWRELLDSPLEEICAQQYVACNEAVLAARSEMPSERWLEIAYEDLIASPVDELRRIFGAFDLRFTEDDAKVAGSLARRQTRTTLTPPRPEKWRAQNPEAIQRILPLVAATERRLGYPLASP